MGQGIPPHNGENINVVPCAQPKVYVDCGALPKHFPLFPLFFRRIHS